MSKNETNTPASNNEGKQKEEPIVQVTPSKDFDLEAYISNYSGHTKIARLIFIAERSKKHEVDALRLAVTEIKNTSNTSLYRRLMEKVGDKLGTGFTHDQAWEASTEKKAIQTKEKLELDLSGAKANTLKDAIRVNLNLNIAYIFYYFIFAVLNFLPTVLLIQFYYSNPQKNFISECKIVKDISSLFNSTMYQ
jgi:hypothetical protein